MDTDVMPIQERQRCSSLQPRVGSPSLPWVRCRILTQPWKGCSGLERGELYNPFRVEVHGTRYPRVARYREATLGW